MDGVPVYTVKAPPHPHPPISSEIITTPTDSLRLFSIWCSFSKRHTWESKDYTNQPMMGRWIGNDHMGKDQSIMWTQLRVNTSSTYCSVDPWPDSALKVIVEPRWCFWVCRDVTTDLISAAERDSDGEGDLETPVLPQRKKKLFNMSKGKMLPGS